MKKLMSITLIAIMTLSLGTSAFGAESANVFKEGNMNVAEISAITTTSVNATEVAEIQEEIGALEKLNLDTYLITEIDTSANVNKYELSIGEYTDIITVDERTDEKISLTIEEGDIVNHFTQTADGRIYLDGNEVIITETTEDISVMNEQKAEGVTRGTIYKSTQSMTPYVSSYPNYLTENKKDLALGERIDKVAVSVLTSLIKAMSPFNSIADLATLVAAPVKTFIVSVYSATTHIGCYSITYTSSYTDYKYVNSFYANASCTGASTTKITYEHFIVY